MYEVAPARQTVDDAVRAAVRLRRPGPRAGRRAPARRPADDLITDLVADRADRRRGGRGRRAAAQRRPRGVGQRVRQRPGRDAAARAAARPRTCRRPWRRCCASTPPCSSSSAPRPTDVEVGDVTVERGAEDRRAARCRPTATRRSSTSPTSSASTATPTRTWPSASACTSASARRWRAWSSASRCRLLFDTLPRPGAGRRAGEPGNVRAAGLPQRARERRPCLSTHRRCPRRRRGHRRQARPRRADRQPDRLGGRRLHPRSRSPTSRCRRWRWRSCSTGWTGARSRAGPPR